MKVAVITNLSGDYDRAEAVGRFFQNQGDEVTWIFSDFFHLTKERVTEYKPDHIYIPTKPYQKNLSLARLWSHRCFARDVRRYLKTHPFDLLYVMIPPNALLPAMGKVKKETGCSLVADIVDLWPESLPVERVKNWPPLRYWRNLRDRCLPQADQVLIECDLYRGIIALPASARTLHWIKGPDAPEMHHEKRSDVLHLAYLGSLNHIVDIDLMASILERLKPSKPVKLHIVGEGENRQRLLDLLEESGIDYQFYGPIYDDDRKKQIFEQCTFGFNLMIDTVKVGLTTKSIDYWYYGLPVINNIRGDTWQFVKDEGVGVNVERDDLETACHIVLARAAQVDHKAVQQFYNRHFTTEIFENTLSSVMEHLK
jgi:hypothetical protein